MTAVCSARNAEFTRALGADEWVDYTHGRLGGKYDRVVQLAGDYRVRELKRLLAPGGTLVLAGAGTGRDGGGAFGPMLRLAYARVSRNVTALIAHVRRDDLVELLGYGITPAVEQTLPLERVADALTAIESGHTRGKIAIAVPGTRAS